MATELTPTDRTVMIGDAAMEVLAAKGGRGLTHRAVDAWLGWPEGTTSRYYRTRDSLMNAVVARYVEVEVAHLEQWERDQVGRPTTTHDDIAAILARTYLEWVDGSVRHIARYELSLEGRRRAPVNEAVVEGRRQLNGIVALLLKAGGCRQSALHATAVVSYLDGLCHDRLLHPEVAPEPKHVKSLFQRWLTGC